MLKDKKEKEGLMHRRSCNLLNLLWAFNIKFTSINDVPSVDVKKFVARWNKSH